MVPTVATATVTYRTARPTDVPGMLRVLAFVNMHNVPSPEMPELLIDKFFVAEVDDLLVGCAGYKVLPDGKGKTTLMAVDPAYRLHGVGQRLQEMRMQKMWDLGCRSVITNADRPETIEWYERKFCYKKIGTLAKIHAFGLPHVDHWTTLESDLVAWQRQKSQ